MNFNLVCLACGQGNRIPQEKLAAGPKCAVCGTALIKTEPTDVSFDVLLKATRIDSKHPAWAAVRRLGGAPRIANSMEAGS
ncbi:hypothetical protein ACEWPM_019560, partial [Roseovarius sp. S4756]